MQWHADDAGAAVVGGAWKLMPAWAWAEAMQSASNGPMDLIFVKARESWSA